LVLYVNLFECFISNTLFVEAQAVILLGLIAFHMLEFI